MRHCTPKLLLTALIPTIAFGTTVGRASAQEITGPVLRVETRLVLLDTTVLDTDGKPVAGLTQEDFSILVDGKQRRIASFDRAEERFLPDAARGRNTTLDVYQPKQFGSSPLTIFVIDEVNTHFSDTVYAVHSLEDFLLKQPTSLPQATELFALKDHGLQLLQGFTADRTLLLQALKKTSVQNAWNLEQSHSVGEGVTERLAVSLSALEQIAHSVRSIPAHKTMLWLGAGFPSVDPTSLTPSVQRMLDTDLEHVTNSLLEARIVLDAVDPTTTAAGMTEITDPAQFAFLQAAGDSSSQLSDPFDKSLDFDRLAPISGGRVLRGRNDIAALVEHAVHAGANYYSLGFRPNFETETRPQFHKIEVLCRKAGVTVLSRQGFYSAIPVGAEGQRNRIQADLNDAVLSALPMTDLKVHAEQKERHYLVQVGSEGLHWNTDANGQWEASVEILAAALSKQKTILAHRLIAESAQAPSASDPDVNPRMVSFSTDLAPSASAAMIRFVVRDASTGHMGTFDLPLKH
jgi:VWFA-related protein